MSVLWYTSATTRASARAGQPTISITLQQIHMQKEVAKDIRPVYKYCLIGFDYDTGLLHLKLLTAKAPGSVQIRDYEYQPGVTIFCQKQLRFFGLYIYKQDVPVKFLSEDEIVAYVYA